MKHATPARAVPPEPGGGALVASAGAAGSCHPAVDRVTIGAGAIRRPGIGCSGASPGPVPCFREGEDVVINVVSSLSGDTPIHGHGFIPPSRRDGVPGIGSDDAVPGETFTHCFPIVRTGTWRFRSQIGLQKPDGAHGVIIMEPGERDPLRCDLGHVVQQTRLIRIPAAGSCAT